MTPARDSTWRPAPHPAIETVIFSDGEFSAVLYDERTNRLQSLNSSAAAVWSLCDGATTVPQMAEELVELFGLDVRRARDDVAEALAVFEAGGALVGSAPPPAAEASGERVLARPPDP